MNKLNKLIGIPFKIGKETFEACDCVGICWLYHKHMHDKNYPHRDGKRMVFRNPKKDKQRILSIIKTWAKEVPFSDLKEGDIILLSNNIKNNIACLGVCVNKTQLLCMHEKIGSCLIKLNHIKDFFITGYRAYA